MVNQLNEYKTYIHYGRVVVLLQFIFIPIYFYFLSFIFVDGHIWFLDIIASDIIVYGFGPLVMAFPFLIWTYGRRYQISDAYETFGHEIWRLPTTIKAFYGFNFVIGLVFLFPLISPIIALFGGYFLAVYLLGWRSEGEVLSRQRKAWILTLLYMPLPLLVIIGFYFGYNPVSTESGVLGFFLQLINLWNVNIDILYTSALIIADAATIGGVLYLVYEGAQQVDYSVTIPEHLITIISIVCFLILEIFLLVFGNSFEVFLNWIHIAAVILGVLMLFIRYWKGLTSSRDTSIKGWLTLVIFQAVNFASGNLVVFSRSTAILVAFSIFLFLFVFAYYHASKRY